MGVFNCITTRVVRDLDLNWMGNDISFIIVQNCVCHFRRFYN